MQLLGLEDLIDRLGPAVVELEDGGGGGLLHGGVGGGLLALGGVRDSIGGGERALLGTPYPLHLPLHSAPPPALPCWCSQRWPVARMGVVA